MSYSSSEGMGAQASQSIRIDRKGHWVYFTHSALAGKTRDNHSLKVTSGGRLSAAVDYEALLGSGRDGLPRPSHTHTRTNAHTHTHTHTHTNKHIHMCTQT